MPKKKKSLIDRVYGGTDSSLKILAINSLLIFFAWPFLSNVIALFVFYAVLYPLSLVFSISSSSFFAAVFTFVYWPWTTPILSVPLLFGISYLVRRRNRKSKSSKSGRAR